MSSTPISPALPVKLAEIVDDFQAVDERERLQLLLEFSRELADLPAEYGKHPELLEQVVECQTPLFVKVDVADGGDRVDLHFSAPAEAPTTRGFASVLQQGLAGATASEVLAVPEDTPDMLGLTRAVTPLRMRGMGAMLMRIKRQIAQQLAAQGAAAS
ncbi:SufE family protein [Tersicoccus sp. MR15.9]|uniref:SufE family protein n=1 Tax=Tersicoccus mangrovi TaxID=3121635 RepID=UPI002FE589CB